MNRWGPATYGDPCTECGFRWSMTQEDAIATVMTAPTQFATLLRGVDGSLRHPDLGWSVVAYVCHVADNLRIWAERLAGLALGDPEGVAPYDQDLLAQARRYDGISLDGALWSLDRAANDWKEAVVLADRVGITLVHPDRGEQALVDVVRSNAHDVYHHRWDIRKILDGANR